MADGVEVNRSIQFVSLDTHPANNALVVTYEILVSIVDRANHRELSRRNKRAQLQIHISQFDHLEENDFKAGRIDLGSLSSEIIRKCPLLLSEHQNPEDIQLHLLYLLNRRQTQLLARGDADVTEGKIYKSRPPSSASTRPGSRLLQQGPYNKSKLSDTVDQSEDVYSYVQSRESRHRCCFDTENFVEQFDEYLQAIEANSDIAYNLNDLSVSNEKIDTYLEGLYGDPRERFLSLAIIRRLCGNDSDANLITISSNRLLVCAMIRNLRDSGIDEYHLRELILYCLIKITSYEDIYLKFIENRDNTSESIDLVKVLSDLLADHLRSINPEAASPQQDLLTIASDRYNYTCAILTILINLFRINGNSKIKLEERIFHLDKRQFLGLTLSELFQFNSKDLMREIRLMGRPTKVINLLNANILLMRQLSMLKEFIQQVRAKNQFFESIVVLLNTLQLSRPGSGNPATSDSILIKDLQTLGELYQLELNLLMLVNNLLMDTKIRAKFIKRKLLKPVLRNLVIFLATSTGKSLTSITLDSNYKNSSVLMVPFRSLYELSCDKLVKLELYKSKIIMKCLLEYLLSASLLDAKRAPESSRTRDDEQGNLSSSMMKRFNNHQDDSSIDDGAITIEPVSVSHLIICVWINLSSNKEASIYGNDLELKGLLREYVDSALEKLGSLIVSSNGSLTELNRENYCLVYLHIKLLRNLTQFMEFAFDEIEWHERCLNQLSEIGDILLALSWQEENLKPFLVDCLASLSNLIAARPDRTRHAESNDGDMSSFSELPRPLASIFGKLFQLKSEDFVGENDDDLLLVSVLLIGFMANRFEICNQAINQVNQLLADGKPAWNQTDRGVKINFKILRACNFILDSKLPDYEMIIHTLFALSQLMNHSQFLRTMLERVEDNNVHAINSTNGEAAAAAAAANAFGGNFNQNDDDAAAADDEDSSNFNMFAQLLVDKLANLVLAAAHGAPGVSAGNDGQQQQQRQQPAQRQATIPKLAVELLNLFRQLEQQTSVEGSFVHKVRFASYNSKWLAAIQASREALESPESAPSREATVRDRLPANCAGSPAAMPASWFSGGGGGADDDDDDDPSAAEQPLEDSMVLFGQPDEPPPLPSSSFAVKSGGGGGGDTRRFNSGELHQLDEEDTEQDDLDELSNSSSFGEAPDLNVIDPNSMIKHLSSRREFRLERK